MGMINQGNWYSSCDHTVPGVIPAGMRLRAVNSWFPIGASVIGIPVLNFRLIDVNRSGTKSVRASRQPAAVERCLVESPLEKARLVNCERFEKSTKLPLDRDAIINIFRQSVDRDRCGDSAVNVFWADVVLAVGVVEAVVSPENISSIGFYGRCG